VGWQGLEPIFKEAIDRVATPADLQRIYEATRKYEERNHLQRRLRPPIKPTAMAELPVCISSLKRILDPAALNDERRLMAAVEEFEKSDLIRLLGVNPPKPFGDLQELHGRVSTLVLCEMWKNPELISLLQSELDTPGGTGEGLAPTKMSKVFRYYRRLNPNLTPSTVNDWIESEFVPSIQNEIRDTYGPALEIATTAHRDAEEAFRREEENYRAEVARRPRDLRQAEMDYRRALAGAMEVQLRVGPAFLIELERLLRAEGLLVRSLPWDGARMVGWKLNAASPGMTNDDFLTAVNSVLGPASLQRNAHGAAVTGSSFADYAYYVAMTAEKLTPWQPVEKRLILL